MLINNCYKNNGPMLRKLLSYFLIIFCFFSFICIFLVISISESGQDRFARDEYFNEIYGELVSSNHDCPCDKYQTIDKYFRHSKKRYSSTCSTLVTHLGNGQKVVSYSFFGQLRDQNGHLTWYSQGVRDNAPLVPKFYGTEWRMRIYHDDLADLEKWSFLCDIACKYPHVDLCDASHIPRFNKAQEMEPTMWRFLPMLDPLVTEFHSRDLDSRPSEREINAVKEFQASSKHYHIMRDHKEHRAPMLAGMWGAKPKMNRSKWKKLIFEILKASKNLKKGFKLNDQIILKDIIYPQISGDVLTHDSYHCGLYKNEMVLPFPTQREEAGYNFVGSQMFANSEPYLVPCPPPCRPNYHKNWIYC